MAIVKKSESLAGLRGFHGKNALIEIEGESKKVNTQNKKFCINKIPIDLDLETIKKELNNRKILFQNLTREKKANGDFKTIITFTVSNDQNLYDLLRKGINIEGVRKAVREFIDKNKLILRCFNCNKIGHSAKTCKNQKTCPRCTKTNCNGDCHVDNWKCTNCGNNHSAAYAGCPAIKKIINNKFEVTKKESYATALTQKTVKQEPNSFKKQFMIDYNLIAIIISKVLWDLNRLEYENLEAFSTAITKMVLETVKNNYNDE